MDFVKKKTLQFDRQKCRQSAITSLVSDPYQCFSAYYVVYEVKIISTYLPCTFDIAINNTIVTPDSRPVLVHNEAKLFI